jgi:hypothetical protein
MAYTVSSKSPTLVKKVGIVDYPRQYVGVTTLAGGVGTVTIPGVRRIVAAFVSAQSTTACSVSATSVNAFSIAGGTTDVIMWLAYCE